MFLNRKLGWGGTEVRESSLTWCLGQSEVSETEPSKSSSEQNSEINDQQTLEFGRKGLLTRKQRGF